MPARSRSQQRLFGMVHAYNKGELRGPRGLRSRIEAIARRVSDSDARHFAETPHAGLPERRQTKEAQVAVTPEQARRMFAGVDLSQLSRSDEDRRDNGSFVGSTLRKALVGSAIGGAAGAGIGGYAAYRAGVGRMPPDRARAVVEAVLRCGLRGAEYGAVAGTGIGVYNKIRSYLG